MMYFIGYFLALLMLLGIMKFMDGEVTVGALLVCLILSIFSWIMAAMCTIAFVIAVAVTWVESNPNFFKKKLF